MLERIGETGGGGAEDYFDGFGLRLSGVVTRLASNGAGECQFLERQCVAVNCVGVYSTIIGVGRIFLRCFMGVTFGSAASSARHHNARVALCVRSQPIAVTGLPHRLRLSGELVISLVIALVTALSQSD